METKSGLTPFDEEHLDSYHLLTGSSFDYLLPMYQVIAGFHAAALENHLSISSGGHMKNCKRLTRLT